MGLFFGRRSIQRVTYIYSSFNLSAMATFSMFLKWGIYPNFTQSLKCLFTIALRMCVKVA